MLSVVDDECGVWTGVMRIVHDEGDVWCVMRIANDEDIQPTASRGAPRCIHVDAKNTVHSEL